MLSSLLRLLFFLDDCSGPFVSEYVVVSTLRTCFALRWLRFLVLDTEIIVSKIVVVVFLNFLDESHVDKILDLLLLVLGPFVKTIILLCLWFLFGIEIFIFLFLLLQGFLMLLAVVVLQKLLLMSFQLVLSQLLDHAYFLYDFFNNTLVDSFALNTHLNITATVPVWIFFLLDFDWHKVLCLPFNVFFTHHGQVRIKKFRAPWFWLFGRLIEVFGELFHHLLDFGGGLGGGDEWVNHIFENILTWGFFGVWDVPTGSVLLVVVSLFEVISGLAAWFFGFVVCLIEGVLDEFLFGRWHF